MQSRKSSLRFARRGDSELSRPDEIPASLELQLTAMTIPCEQNTPRGDLPSTQTLQEIKRQRDGRSRPWAKLFRIFAHKKARGVSPELLTAPLYLLAAALTADSRDDIRTLIELDKRAELESNLAADRYQAEPTLYNRQRIAQCESVEQSISARLIACAARMES